MDWHKISNLYFGLRVSQATAMSILLITGLIGNALVCFLVRRTSRLRTVTNLIISNLAAADLGVCVFKIPVSLVCYRELIARLLHHHSDAYHSYVYHLDSGGVAGETVEDRPPGVVEIVVLLCRVKH